MAGKPIRMNLNAPPLNRRYARYCAVHTEEMLLAEADLWASSYSIRNA
jgi:hypothetical protein